MNEKNKFINTWKNTCYMFNKIWKHRSGKIYVLIKGVISVCGIIFSLGGTVFPGLIINELTKGELTNRVIWYTVALLSIPVINQLLGILFGRIIFKTSERLTLIQLEEFYKHVTKMDYETLESPDIQDQKNRAVNILGNSFQVVDYLWNFLSAILMLISISTIIASLNIFVVVLIIVIVGINSVITKKLDKERFEFDKIVQAKERKQWGINYMLDMFEYAKELRLFNIKDMLIEKLINSEKDININKWQMAKKQDGVNILRSILSLVNQSTLYVYLIYRVIWHRLPIGNMTIFLSAAGQFSGALSSVAQSYLSLSAFSLKIEDYCQFINVPQKQYLLGKDAPNLHEDSIIEFKDVSFRYPGSERYALEKINIKLSVNEKLCVVGPNGAGKTTFIKLLTRLYFPSEGEILLDGVNINTYDYEKYQRLFAPVFQDFSKYYMTLRENIVLADKFDEEKLDKVCSSVGIDALVKKLPKGYETQVDKWIDEEGFEPSGGENQRIAIARACYHGGDIYILDEPTAALDPLAEYEIYTQFANMIHGKTAILITHRLSAVQLADTVAVFNNGQVVEYGKHKDLYANGGIYTEMFDKQAQFYRDKPKNETQSDT